MFKKSFTGNMNAWMLFAALCVSAAVLAHSVFARDSDDDRARGGSRGGMPRIMPGGSTTMVTSNGYLFLMKGLTLYKINTTTLKVEKKATIAFDRPNGRRPSGNRRRTSDDW